MSAYSALQDATAKKYLWLDVIILPVVTLGTTGVHQGYGSGGVGVRVRKLQLKVQDEAARVSIRVNVRVEGTDRSRDWVR